MPAFELAGYRYLAESPRTLPCLPRVTVASLKPSYRPTSLLAQLPANGSAFTPDGAEVDLDGNAVEAFHVAPGRKLCSG